MFCFPESVNKLTFGNLNKYMGGKWKSMCQD